MSAGILAITGGVVEPEPGERIDGGTVLVRDGKILAVGRDAPPADATLVDATGCRVLPGFVDAHAHIGVHEVAVGLPGADVNESGLSNAAGIRALDAINPHDPAFDDALTGGVTTVVVKPGSGAPLGGQSVALKTAGGRIVDDRVLRDPLSLKSAFGENPKAGANGGLPTTRMGIAYVIRQALEDARHYGGPDAGTVARDLHQEVLQRLLAGELPWDVHAHRQDDIATALRIAREYGLRLVINHGTEAYLLAGIIAEQNIPVILGPLSVARSKVELACRRETTPRILHRTGIPFALMTDHPEVPIELLSLQASLAVRAGLPADAALRAITTTPAEIYGLDDRVGSLRPGRDADIVLWSGDPLDTRSRVRTVYVDGVAVFGRPAA